MKISIMFIIFFVFLNLSGCTQEDHSSDADGHITTDTPILQFYGIADNGFVTVIWKPNPVFMIIQYSLYRHTQIPFSQQSASLLSSSSAAPEYVFVDSTVMNDSIYYYTLLCEFEKDGKSVLDIDPPTLQLHPRNYDAIATDKIIYSRDIQPIFSNGCAIHGCHGGDHSLLRVQTALRALDTTEGSHYRLTSWDQAVAGVHGLSTIIPFKASKSHLLMHLNRDTLVMPTALPEMPPSLRPSKSLFGFLYRWIESGARYDDGSVAFSSTPARGWAYVTNQGEDLTAVIDMDIHQVVRYITTGVENTQSQAPLAPHNVIVDSKNLYYYVNLVSGGKVMKYRVADNEKVGETAAIFSSPTQVALSQNNDTAFVTNFEATKQEITFFSTESMQKLGTIYDPAMLKPHGVSVTPDFSKILVCNSFSDNITVIDAHTLDVIRTVPLSGSVPALPVNYRFQYEPYQLVVTPDSKFAYVTCRISNEVRIIDLQQLATVDSITVGKYPLIPAISPDGQYVFTPNRDSKSVSVIRIADRTVTKTYSDVGVGPHGIAISKDGSFAYVSCENLTEPNPPHHPSVGGKIIGTVAVIDLVQQQVIRQLEVGNFAAGIAVTH